MNERSIAVITGANSGIGYETTKALATKGYHIIMVCRNLNRCEIAIKKIKESVPDFSYDLYLADLSVIKQTKNIGKQIADKYPIIDLLINNAGLFIAEEKQSEDGFELTLANNHFSAFVLTHALLPSLQKSADPRIVNVASQAQMLAKLTLDNIHLKGSYGGMLAYANSKLYNIMFTLKLSDLVKHTPIKVNCMHPGGVNTGFGKNTTGITGFIFKQLGWLLRTPKKGAETVIWLATSVDMTSKTGGYYYDKKEIKAQANAYKEENLSKLWSLSEEMCGIRYQPAN
jgi:NAD(P)-dependent dehydrogenase (short-subunit alcohol dehydrogenase family)